MEKYKKSAINLIKNPIFIVPVIIVAIASFGYLLSHSTVNVDVLSADRYFYGNELVSQQRIFAPLINKVLNIMGFYPFLVDFLAVLFLIISTILYCSFFDVISKNKIKTIAYTIFSCFFISYPLMMEYFTYEPMGLTTSFGFCFIAISLILFYEYLLSHKKNLFIFSIIILWCAISLYESFATVYIMGVLGTILIDILYVNEKKLKLSKNILIGIKYLIPLIIAILFNYIITNFILIIYNIPRSPYADKTITYAIIGIAGGIKYLINTVIIDYFINALGYLPMTILVISSIISIIMGIVLSIKKKDISIFLVVLGMNITLLLLSIIQGRTALYRTCQQFQLFIAIIFMILTQVILTLNINKIVKNVFIFIVFLTIFYQVKGIYKLQYINDLKYQKEKNDLIIIGNELASKYDIENKPVVFCGQYELPDIIKEEIYIKPDSFHYKVLDYYNRNFYKNIKNVKNYKCIQTSVQSYINWGISAFFQEGIPSIEIIKFLKVLGYDFKAGNLEMYKDANLKITQERIPEWPKEGSIAEQEEYILVNL